MEKKGILKEYRALLHSFKKTLPVMLKYQIITKLLMAAIIFPLFWAVTRILIESKGFGAISNNSIMNFILSPQGFVFLIIATILCFFVILMEFGGFIAISARSLNGEDECAFKELMKFNLKKLPKMLGSGSIVLLLYILVMIPLTETNVPLSFMENFRIPNFITSVIFANPFYSALYYGLIVVLFFISIRWIFAFHFIVIGEEKPKAALKHSSEMMWKNKKNFVLYFVLIALLNLAVITVVFSLWTTVTALIGAVLDLDKAVFRMVTIALFLVQSLAISLLSFLVVPFELHHLTVLFYEFGKNTEGFSSLANRYPEIPQKTRPSLLDRLLRRKRTAVVLLTLAIFGTAIFSGLFFEQLFTPSKEILVIGHRGGGGFEVPENSLASIQKSIDYGAEYVEIDVQRTKDGAYILNHDHNFKRMADEKRSAKEMTLAEIKSLDIGKKYPGYEGERVPTVEELFDFCKGRIGIFVELKGESADEKMADDMIRMIKERGMEEETVIMALDYSLIRYVNGKYPDINAGFTYFMAFGDLGSFESGYLILEEDAATPKALRKIHAAGKKAAVWTVNKQASMDRFVKEDVDAIITDDVKRLKETMKEEKEKGTLSILIETFLKDR